MKIHIANQRILNKTLQRKKMGGDFVHEVDLGGVLREILHKANEFVPSESGSILLDDPTIKQTSDEKGKLYFLACFGQGSDAITGTSLPNDIGIVGETYQSGKSYLSKDVKKDDKFYEKVDETTKFQTKSIIAIPIWIEDSIIGVIELLNREGRENYDRKDLALLEIFAEYTSTLIQNALDARRFEELSKMDNLTGLSNDRFFYEMLSARLKKAIKGNHDLILVFFDLDHFKEVNDAHGHLAGSRVLKEVARIVEEVFSREDVTMARYGGDEFVILVSGINVGKAVQLAEDLRNGIEKYIFLKEFISAEEPDLNIKGVITCSIGVASLMDNVKSRGNLKEMEKELIKAADSSMYRAKERGKNKVVLAEGKSFEARCHNLYED